MQVWLAFYCDWFQQSIEIAFFLEIEQKRFSSELYVTTILEYFTKDMFANVAHQVGADNET